MTAGVTVDQTGIREATEPNARLSAGDHTAEDRALASRAGLGDVAALQAALRALSAPDGCTRQPNDRELR
ncbi:MAG: hypothetical protein QM758_25760 [Armatimonas sp.]